MVMTNLSRLCCAAIPFVVLISAVRADTINLVCEGKSSGGGKQVEVHMSIDTAAKYVRVEQPALTREFREGVYGRPTTSGQLFLGTDEPGRQYVRIDDDVIKYGRVGGNDREDFRIDRRSGEQTVDGRIVSECSPSRR